MSTRLEIETAIMMVIQMPKIKVEDIRVRMNVAITKIAAGIKLPDGRISPPLPDLYTSDTVSTATDAAYASLPDTYHRNVVYISNSNKMRINPPLGGDYYSFNKFLERSRYKDLSESGSVYMCAIKGSNLYYQGIPSTSTDLLVNFYRKPVDMSGDDETPDGIPDGFQMDLVKHAVLMDVWGDLIGNDVKDNAKYPDKAFSKQRYHEKQFYITLENMIQFVGENEGQPFFFYSGGDYE